MRIRAAASVPLAPLAVALGTGIALAGLAPPRVAWITWLAAAGAGGIAVLTRRLAIGAIALLAAVVALGALRVTPVAVSDDHVARLSLPAEARLVARVAAAPLPAPGRTRLLLDVEQVDGAPRRGAVSLTAYGEPPPAVVGQLVHVQARLSTPTGFANPGGFDYVARLARDGIHVVGTAKSESVVPLEPPAPSWHARVRRRVVAAIDAALPPASAALLSGLLLGERSALPPELDDGFRRAGVYHVLAVSGFNVAIVASAVFVVARFVGAGARTAAAAAAVIVLGFGAVVGPQASVLRAVVMAVLVLAAVLIERDTEVLNSLAAAALVILALRPNDLFDPGFQLSFAATAGIVLAPHPRGIVLGALTVSASAQAAVLPITLWHFHQVSLVGLVANLAAVPLAAAATVVGLVGGVLAFAWDGAARVAFDAVWPVLLALRAVVALAAAAPGALVYLPAPPIGAVVAYVAALLGAVVAWGSRQAHPVRARRLALGAGSAMAVAIALAAWPLVRPGDGRLRVAVLDVGQGDAIVIEGPDGRAVVVDAGSGGAGRLDAGARAVAPYLWSRGHLRVAGTVVTHAHADHAGGMPAVRARFAGRSTWSEADLAAAPRALGGAVITALPAVAGARVNDRALVVRVAYRDVTFLLASDITGATEAALLARGTSLDATVLKVAHHGARDGSTAPFLAAARPTVAVVSVGARNPYRHPDPGTLARLEAAGARVLRTDRDGALLFETDGRTLAVTRYRSGTRHAWCVDPESAC
ncbi:MAG: ComEC/Rec2 family competence protein [Candidatus Rokubacteria bacterium]|nr:ComEC/Rec2 family competence protein [Candidatus Rokubacteria bacterium]